MRRYFNRVEITQEINIMKDREKNESFNLARFGCCQLLNQREETYRIKNKARIYSVERMNHFPHIFLWMLKATIRSCPGRSLSDNLLIF